MRKLSLLCAILVICGAAKASTFYSEMTVTKHYFWSVDEAQQAKSIVPQYSDWIDSYIVAVKQGMTAFYEIGIYVEPQDDPISSAYVIKPGGAHLDLVKKPDGDFGAGSEIDNGPPEFYVSTNDLSSVWPSGSYELHVTFKNGTTQTVTVNMPDYDTTPFPDKVSETIVVDPTNKALSLNWTTLGDNYREYDVWATEIKKQQDIYDSSDNDQYQNEPPSKSEITPLIGAYAGKGDYDIGIETKNWEDSGTTTEGSNCDISFDTQTELPYFKKAAATIENSIDKVTVKAGTGKSTDSISFSGTLDAVAADLIIAKQDGNDIIVLIGADNMPDMLEFDFPLNDTTFKKGVYSGTNASKTQSFKFNTKTGKMSFSAKNIDLKGLSCPIFIGVIFGHYGAKLQADASVVNSGKAAPQVLLMGVADSINVNKAAIKQGKDPNTDTLAITGTFTIEGSYDKANDFGIKIGGQSYTIAGTAMTLKGSTESCTKVACTQGGLLTAKLDFTKCTFSIMLTGVNLNAGEQEFGLNVFGTYISTIIYDRFAGKFNLTLYGDDNLGDGFDLAPEKVAATITTSNHSDYTLSAKGVSFKLLKTEEYFIELNPRPQNMPNWIQPNMCMLSDGFNYAFFTTGKDSGPQDVSISVGAWTSKAAVTTSQLAAGSWTITWIYQDDIASNMMNRFLTMEEGLSVTDLGNNQVKIQDSSYFSGSKTLTLNGSNLVPVSTDSTVKYFSMVTNGSGIAIAVIEDNGGVVSARIGLARQIF